MFLFLFFIVVYDHNIILNCTRTGEVRRRRRRAWQRYAKWKTPFTKGTYCMISFMWNAWTRHSCEFAKFLEVNSPGLGMGVWTVTANWYWICLGDNKNVFKLDDDDSYIDFEYPEIQWIENMPMTVLKLDLKNWKYTDFSGVFFQWKKSIIIDDSS